MTFDWQSEIRKEAEHLVRLSKDPAWVDHARKRVRERLDDPAWAGFSEAMQTALENSNEQITGST